MKHIIFIAALFSSSCLLCQDLVTLKSEAGTEDSFEEIFVSLNGGCSLSCGIAWTISTTSTLKPQGENNYQAQNMDDGDRKTAWAEGVTGYGIGEKIVIHFLEAGETMKIPFRGFSVTNGYAKSVEIWKANSRVKTFQLTLNGAPTYLIELADSIFPQHIVFDEELYVSSGDTVILEIKGIYKGEKYADTVVTDISLSGGH